MYSKIIKEIEVLTTQLIRNKELTSYVAKMCADIINQEMSGKMSQQDCLNALEAVWLGLDRRYREMNLV